MKKITFLLSFIFLNVYFLFSQDDKKALDMLNSMSDNYKKMKGFTSSFTYSMKNLTEDITDRITSGTYRTVPIIRFFNQVGKPIVVIADTPEEQWHSKKSEKVLYLPENQFSPMIDFTVGGWSLQVAMETVIQKH